MKTYKIGALVNMPFEIPEKEFEGMSYFEVAYELVECFDLQMFGYSRGHWEE